MGYVRHCFSRGLCTALILCSGACNDAMFSGNSEKAPSAQPKQRLSGGNDLEEKAKDGENPNNGNIAEDSEAQGDVEVRGGEICYKRVLPLHMVIAIDVTGSMSDQIRAVQANLIDFVNTVKSIKPQGSSDALRDVQLGIVTYRDNVDRVFNLTADVGSLRSGIQSLSAEGGDDAPEAGFMGALQAMKMLQDGTMATSTKSAINVLLMISDTYSHNGGPAGNRNYDTTSLRQSLALPVFKNFLLYSSVPDSDPYAYFKHMKGDGLSFPSPTPAAQWDELREAWTAAHPDVKTSMGKNLRFPFDANTLLRDLPAAIQAAVKICH